MFGNKAVHSNYESEYDTKSVLEKIKSVYFTFEVNRHITHSF